MRVLLAWLMLGVLVIAGTAWWLRDSTAPSHADAEVPTAAEALECPSPEAVQETWFGEGGTAPVEDPQDVLGSDPLHLMGVESDRGFVEAARSEARALFTYDADGAAVAAVSAHRIGAGSSAGWAAEAWATCTPEELPVDLAERLGHNVWTDDDGRPVPRQKVTSYSGSAHCDQEEITLLHVGDEPGVEGLQFVRDPEGQETQLLVAPYDGQAVLPTDAEDTGWHRRGQELWLAADMQAAYLVGADGDVELWPRARVPIGCA